MKADLNTLLQSRILRLDGGLGTMIQALQLEEWDFRGREFLKWKCPLKGCMDLLCLTAPRSVGAIHRAYLQAGADIVTTNSFSANAISLREYGLEKYARRIAREAARIAREEADKFDNRFVAGSMGPTSKTASIAASVEDSAARDVTFAELAEAYYEQAAGLAEGGVDAFLLETVFDTLNAKAAIFALERLRRDTGCDIPLMISVTVSQKAGRTLSGQTIEAFWTSVKHGRPLSVGINCSFGAREMLPHLERLAAVADCYISVHPNAGLPNISGGYDETPESFAAAMKPYAERGLVNIMGGCCGTTPDFIKALGPLVDSFAPRRLPDSPRETVVCGLEALRIVPEANFINIGERCNVAGSAKFARMIREGDYAGAIAVARTQVAAGGQIIDVCMDDGLIDGPAAMRTFLNMAAGEVDIARVPFMIDSSSLDTIVAGLECCQGKAIVNSISLKEGPEEFLRRAALIRSYGAAAVVMLFDEEGQATSFERKIAVARRAYDLLIESGFPAEDIIFDPNILAVATGIKEHDRYALDFIEATRWIKENLPYAKVSGGVSNLS
ncbi:MAG: homocysteine S-methyltransferase family protein, partial [Bacteroidales bacterium]|nr:homocysteine S-methyltransferase family protein [Bacteroidales bacterium]